MQSNHSTSALRKMFMSGLWAPCLLVAYTTHADDVQGEGYIIHDGRPVAEIVLAERPARMSRLAAHELQVCLAKITGATLTITNQPSADVPVQIFVGKSPGTDNLGLSVTGLAHGAFITASGTNWLALLGPDKDFEPIEPWSRQRGDLSHVLKEWDGISGGTFASPYALLRQYYLKELDVWLMDDAGTLNAVYEFLRGLGVRWYFPGELGEIVPQLPSIALPPATMRVVRPDFPLRSFMWWGMQNGVSLDEALWMLRLNLNYGPELLGLTQSCHGMKFVTTREEVKLAHPEYYALWDGKRAVDHRESGAPCLASEGLFDLHLRYARAVFDHYREPLISLDVCDGYGYGVCKCELCRDKGTPERGREGSMSDYVWGYVERAARELLRSHPDRRVSGLAYGSYRLPPARIETLSPNLALLFCQTRAYFYDIARRDHDRALRKEWFTRLPSREMYIFDYYSQNRPGTITEGLPVYFMSSIAGDLRDLRGVSMGDTIDSYRPAANTTLPWHYLAVMHLNCYVTSRLWWQADQDLNAMLDEYFSLFYGPAALEMQAFVAHAEVNWPKMAENKELIDESLELLEQARRVAGDGVHGQRVDLLLAYTQPMRLLRQRLAKERDQVPEIRALRRPSSQLVIDGHLNDEFWARVRQISLRNNNPAKIRPAQATTCMIACDDNYALCLGLRCSENNWTKLPIIVANSNAASILDGDYVMLLIETPVHSFYRIVVNPDGAVFEQDCAVKGAAPRWTSGGTFAVQRNENDWTIEMRLPPAGDMAREITPENGIAGRRPSPLYPWYVNVVRRRVRGGIEEIFIWNPTSEENPLDPMKFGKVWAK